MAYWIYVAYGTYVVTYLTGLSFYLRFDAKRRPLRRRLLGLHLVMAVLTFITLTAAMGLYAFPGAASKPETSSHSTMWYDARQHRAELKQYQATHSGHLPAGFGQ
jgi:thiol:disulfide interchange protein